MSEGKGFIESALKVMHPSSLLRRMLFIIFFGAGLGIKNLVKNINSVGEAGGNFWNYIVAAMQSTWQGIWIALATIWGLVSSWGEYWRASQWGNITVGIVLGILVTGFLYQPVRFFVDMVMGGNDNGSKFMVSLVITLVIVAVLSAVTYYGGYGEPVIERVNSTVTDVHAPINATIAQNASLVNQIDMGASS